jgi:hypothetical protein
MQIGAGVRGNIAAPRLERILCNPHSNRQSSQQQRNTISNNRGVDGSPRSAGERGIGGR